MEPEVKEEVADEATDKAMSQLELEDKLIESGVMIPAEDLVHYMTRNASYMKLIESEEFKESGINLEEVLDDEFIKEQFKMNAQTAQVMRYVTEKVIEKMQEVTEEDVNE